MLAAQITNWAFETPIFMAIILNVVIWLVLLHTSVWHVLSLKCDQENIVFQHGLSEQPDFMILQQNIFHPDIRMFLFMV